MIYSAIDDRMDSRRRDRREARMKQDMEEYRKKRPRIQEQFADAKRQLGELKDEDWASIPESLDFSRRNKLMDKGRGDRFAPVPDAMLMASAGAANPATSGMLDSREQKLGGLSTPISGLSTPLSGLSTPLSGLATPLGGMTDYTSLRKARDQMLSLKLDRMADSVSGQTVVDPKGYLTDLNSLNLNLNRLGAAADVSDIKKARALLKSVTTTNPKHAPGWIAAARLERETGRISQARALIAKGCEMCPKSDDVWIEAATLNVPKNARVILAKAVEQVPTSVKLWMTAVQYEEDVEAKKAVLRRALELIPNSVRLWKAAIELETPEDARVLLSRAVELVPQSVEMWLALARLETYENAKIVLNRAGKAIPTEPAIWITAAKLEEANGNTHNVELIVNRAVKALAAHQVVIKRESWLKEAMDAEKSQALATCQAIIKSTLGQEVDEQDRKATFLHDAEELTEKGAIHCARAVYNQLLALYPGKKSIWLKAAQLEKTHGSLESLEQVLKRAVQFCPQAEVLWLMAAKEKWLAGDVDGARAVLNAAFAANPDSEDVWLAAVKLESDNNQHDHAKILLAKARERASTVRVWLKSAMLERVLGERDKERSLLEEGLKKFPQASKLWIMLAQHHADASRFDDARQTFKSAVKVCPGSVELWLCYAALEVAQGNLSKARAVLDSARLKIPKNARLWLASVRVERKANQTALAAQLLAKALQECPNAGMIWAHAIGTDARPLRRGRSYQALQRCSEDAHVFAAVAKLFWLDRKAKKARSWFQRAVTVDPDLGDAWAFFYKFEVEQGTPDTQKAVIKRCVEADPHHGEWWVLTAKKHQKSTPKTEDVLKEIVAQLKEPFDEPSQLPTGGLRDPPPPSVAVPTASA